MPPQLWPLSSYFQCPYLTVAIKSFSRWDYDDVCRFWRGFCTTCLQFALNSEV